MIGKREMAERTTLCFVVDRKKNAILMIHKKRGQGAGKWNVPGGKVKEGERVESAAARETWEETGILPSELEQAGYLEFTFPEGNSWDNNCTVFTAERFSGELIPESEECSAEWVPLSNIPYSAMWDADKLWVPLLLKGEKFRKAYVFDGRDLLIEERDLP